MKTSALFPVLALSAATALLLTARPSPASSAERDPHDGIGLFLTASPSPAPLHGISVRLTPEGRAVVGTCTYEGGIAAAGAQVTIFAPGAEAPHHSATTDPAGLFAFVPGAPGEWRVVVDDGLGHRREARIQVDGDGMPMMGAAVAETAGEAHEAEDHVHDDAGHTHDAAEPTHAPAEEGEHTHEAAADVAQEHDHGSGGSSRPWQLATGLSLIFGLTGFAYGFRARRPTA